MNIASREEILKIPKTPSYSPDLSYLTKAPKTSLAGRLVDSNLQTEGVPVLTKERQADYLTRRRHITWSTTKMMPDVAAITQRRKEARLAREAEAGTPYALSTIGFMSYIFFKAQNFNKTIRSVQTNADKLNSLLPSLNSLGPLPRAQSAKKIFADHELSPSSLKGREERHVRKSRSRHDPEPSADDELSLSALKRGEKRRLPESRSADVELLPSALKRKEEGRLPESESSHDPESPRRNEEESGHDLDSVDLEEYELASPTVHPPEFIGPEPIPERFDSDFRIVQDHPSAKDYLNPNLIPLAGGIYSRYTFLPSSISNDSASPIESTVVNTVGLALSRQRDYNFPQRKHTVDIVKTLAQGRLAQARKARHRALEK